LFVSKKTQPNGHLATKKRGIGQLKKNHLVIYCAKCCMMRLGLQFKGHGPEAFGFPIYIFCPVLHTVKILHGVAIARFSTKTRILCMGVHLA
jgi:hypothetical protein